MNKMISYRYLITFEQSTESLRHAKTIVYIISNKFTLSFIIYFADLASAMRTLMQPVAPRSKCI